MNDQRRMYDHRKVYDYRKMLARMQYLLIGTPLLFLVSTVLSFLALSIIPFAAAQDATGTLLIDKQLFDKESFSANNDVFIIHLDNDARIIVSTPTIPLSIPKTDCATINVTRICYNESNFDASRKEMKATVRVYSVKPSIQIFRTAPSSSDVLIGSSIDIVAWINNTGYTIAEKVRYADEYPPEFNITSSSCVRTGNRIVWEGPLSAGEGYSCDYIITPIAESVLKQKASAEYYDGIKISDVYSDQLVLNAKNRIEYTKSSEKTSIYAGETTNLTINVTGRGAAAGDIVVGINFTIIVPSSLSADYNSGSVYKLSGSASEYSAAAAGSAVAAAVTAAGSSAASVYLWKTSLYENQTDQVTFQIIGRKIGTSEIVVKSSYGVGDAYYSLKDEKMKYEVKGQPISLYTVFDTSPKYESGYSYPLLITLQNPSEYLSCRNVRLEFETDVLKLDNYTLEFINKSSNKYVVNTAFTAPTVVRETVFPLNVFANCSTEYGDDYYASLRKTIKVGSLDPIEITQSASSSSIESTRESTITITAKNPRNVPVEAEIKDIIPDELAGGISGTNSTPFVSAVLGKSSTTTIYSYVITAPKVSQQRVFVINTTAKYIDNVTGERVGSYKELLLTVNPVVHKLSYSRRALDTNIYEGKFITIRHEITNSDTVPIKNIIVMLPVSQEADLRGAGEGSREKVISRLNPGEIVTLDIEELRIKPGMNFKQVSLDPVALQYEDKDGFRYNATFAPLVLSVQPGTAYDPSPVLFIEKTAKLGRRSASVTVPAASAAAGQTAEQIAGDDGTGIIISTITIANNGSYPITDIFVVDGKSSDEKKADAGKANGKNWENWEKNWSLQSLSPGEKISLEHSRQITSAETAGMVNLGRAEASYKGGISGMEQYVYSTASNEVIVAITEEYLPGYRSDAKSSASSSASKSADAAAGAGSTGSSSEDESSGSSAKKGLLESIFGKAKDDTSKEDDKKDKKDKDSSIISSASEEVGRSSEEARKEEPAGPVDSEGSEGGVVVDSTPEKPKNGIIKKISDFFNSMMDALESAFGGGRSTGPVK